MGPPALRQYGRAATERMSLLPSDMDDPPQSRQQLTRELRAEAGVEIDYDRPVHTQAAAAASYLQMEAD